MSAKEKMNALHGRKSHDYSPTMGGSKEEQDAINARRELLNSIASRPYLEGLHKTKKSWHQRMQDKAVGFDTDDNLARHARKNAERAVARKMA